MKKKNLFIMLTITMLLTGCGMQVEDDTLEQAISISNSVISEEGGETETVGQVEGNVNGVFIADTYEMYDMQVPTEQIVDENMKESYTKLTLLSHKVDYSEEADASITATDLINMYAEISTEYFTISQHFDRWYWYWGGEMGWVPNVNNETEWSADISGFSNTYWKLPDGEGETYYTHMFGEMYDYEHDQIEIYFHFGDVYITPPQKYRVEEDWQLYAAMNNGEIVLKYGNDIKRMPLEFVDVGTYEDVLYNGGHYQTSVYLTEEGHVTFKLYVPETGGEAIINYLKVYEDGSNQFNHTYEINNGGYLQPVTEEEYMNFINQSSGENVLVESNEATKNEEVVRDEETEIIPECIDGIHSYESDEVTEENEEVVDMIYDYEFTTWDETQEVMIYVHFSDEFSGTMNVRKTIYRNGSDMYEGADYYFYEDEETEGIYRIYDEYTGYKNMYFDIASEECFILNIYDEQNGTVESYLEAEWAYSNVG